MSEQSAPRRVDGDRPQSAQAKISKEMVRLYKEQFGRGPTKVRTDFAGDSTVICTLEETFTPVEHRLAEMGEAERLRETRLFFQYATEKEFKDAVERILGRRVRSFISGVDVVNDVAAEIFYLDGRQSSGSAGSES